jgi:para-nitrobenzyl esterase
VTIAGQSAGGMASATLLAVPKARGLFNKAILMSGSIDAAAPKQVVDDFVRRFETILGAPADRETLAEYPMAKVIEAQVRAADTDEERGSVHDVVERFARGFVLRPQVDGDLLPADPGAAIADGASAGVPVMAGATADEFNFLIGEANANDADRALRRFFDDPARSAGFRRARGDAPARTLIGQAISDFTIRAPAARFAEARTDQSAPTYLYDFRWRPREGLLGACHCLDVPFAFTCLGAEKVVGIAGSHPPQTLADAVHESWVSFVKTGGAGWPAYRRDEREAIVFDDPCRIERDPMQVEREIWLRGA